MRFILRALAVAGALTLVAAPVAAQQFPSGSVQGNGTSSTAAPKATDINSILFQKAASDSCVFRRSGSSVACGVLATGGIGDGSVTDAKISARTALSVFGRSANSSGVGADIAATSSSDAVLRESGGSIGFGTIATAGIANNAVTDGKMRQGSARTVIGRAGSTTGDVADIAATGSSDAVLRESGGSIGFGTIATAGIANNAVTDAKLRQSGALTLLGRSANSAGNVADIQATAASGCVFREASNAIGCGTLSTAALAANIVTNAKLAQMANGTTKCRTTAGTGDPEDCSASQMRSLLSLVPGTDVQTYDSDLAALASNSTNGLWARTGAGTGAARTLTAPAAGISVTNGDGVAGNPTLALTNDLAAIEGLASTGYAARTAADTWAQRTFQAGTGMGVTNGDGVAGNTTYAITDAELLAIAGLTSAADKVPYFTGPGAAALFDSTSYGRSLVNASNAAALRTLAGLVIGTDVQAYDGELAAIAGLTSANNKCFYWTGAGTAANFDCSSYGRGLINAADASAARTLAGLVIGTDVQAYNARLAGIAGLASTANRLYGADGSGNASLITMPAAGLSLSGGALALANDLSAIEALSGTGFVVRTADDAWAQRSISVPTGLSITNPAGIAGNPTIAWDVASLSANGAPTPGSTFVLCDTGGTLQKCDVADLGVGGGSGGMNGDERQRYALSLAYESKFLGDVRRVPKMMATGFNAATNALRGIDASSSGFTPTATNAASSYVSPTIMVGSQISTSGKTKIGNMTDAGGLAAAFDGTTNQAQAASAYYTNPSATEGTVGVDWGSGVTNTPYSAVVTATNDRGFSFASGVGAIYLDIEGSNNGSSWTLLGRDSSVTSPNTASNGVQKTITLNMSTAYRYHRLRISLQAGGTLPNPAVAEVQFYNAAVNNMTLITAPQTSSSSASSVRVLMEIEPVDSIALNTDLTVDVTCNGGTDWAPATASSVGTGQSGRTVVETADTACTSGTSIQGRIKSLNNKNLRAHLATVTWH